MVKRALNRKQKHDSFHSGIKTFTVKLKGKNLEILENENLS